MPRLACELIILPDRIYYLILKVFSFVAFWCLQHYRIRLRAKLFLIHLIIFVFKFIMTLLCFPVLPFVVGTFLSVTSPCRGVVNIECKEENGIDGGSCGPNRPC